jgi:hypothetical protein
MIASKSGTSEFSTVDIPITDVTDAAEETRPSHRAAHYPFMSYGKKYRNRSFLWARYPVRINKVGCGIHLKEVLVITLKNMARPEPAQNPPT